jgi:hypothetical protein
MPIRAGIRLIGAVSPLILLFGAAAATNIAPVSGPNTTGWQHQELRRFPAAEAIQGVAVDDRHFYPIDNRSVGKYSKETGERVAGWEGPKDGAIKHLNGGVVLYGLLYCPHSNFPDQPPTSSVEIWDTRTMKHVGTHSFGLYEGSLTWVVSRDNHWFACFAHYAKAGSETGNPALTQVVKLDNEWRRVAGWVFPQALIKRFAGYSSSGGSFGPGDFLYVTGHDAKELYILTFPKSGSILQWEGTIPISAEGQSFSWDPTQTNVLYSISRKAREIIVSEIRPILLTR